jgi:hypothetical protein
MTEVTAQTRELTELERVRFGSSWLDEHWPTTRLGVLWYSEIVLRLDELVQTHPCRCVLGQLGEYALLRRGWAPQRESRFEGVSGYDALTTPVEVYADSSPSTVHVVLDLHELFGLDPDEFADEFRLGFDGGVSARIWALEVQRKRSDDGGT